MTTFNFRLGIALLADQKYHYSKRAYLMQRIYISIKRIIFGTLFIHNITALTTHRKTFGFGNNFNNIFFI